MTLGKRMSSEIKNSSTDEIRMKNHRTLVQNRNELELRDLSARHSDEVQQLVETQTSQLDNMRHAYDVQISQEGEVLGEKLADIRLGADERTQDEKKIHEQELTKIQRAHQSRVEEYRKNAEAQIQTIRREHQKNAEALHAQSIKSARREREYTKT